MMICHTADPIISASRPVREMSVELKHGFAL